MGLLGDVSFGFYVAGILVWDGFLSLANLVLSSRPAGTVVPVGYPGYGGSWPEFIPPRDGDSRCSCPALNALANHGILPRDGRGIPFTALTKRIRATYNFSPSFCSLVPHYAARMLNKRYEYDTFDLHELDLHNGIEHDASLTRLDAAQQPNQSVKHVPYIEELLSFATGKKVDGHPTLTERDMSRISGKRRVEAKAVDPSFSLSLFHKLFGSINSSTMLTIFGGHTGDLRSILLDERIPDGWESRARKPFGLTLFVFNFTVLPVELGIRPSDWAAGAKRDVRGQSM